jgi:hypothetical protein
MRKSQPARVVTDLSEQSVVPLPSWTDAAAVTTYITSIVGTVFAVITGIHPGYTEPAIVQALLPSVGALVAAGAQIVNVITHRSVQKAAIVAQYATFGHH